MSESAATPLDEPDDSELLRELRRIEGETHEFYRGQLWAARGEHYAAREENQRLRERVELLEGLLRDARDVLVQLQTDEEAFEMPPPLFEAIEEALPTDGTPKPASSSVRVLPNVRGNCDV